MDKCFKSLAEASKIIGSIQESAEIQFKEYINLEGATVIEKIASYLNDYFKPLYKCKALDDHCLARTIDGISIVKKYCYDKKCQMFALGLNIPLGGYRTYLTLLFYENQPVIMKGDINDMTIKVLVNNWMELKTKMNKHCEGAIENFNRDCKTKVDSFIEWENKIKNFTV